MLRTMELDRLSPRMICNCFGNGGRAGPTSDLLRNGLGGFFLTT
jgi:hypothetical protein